MIFKNKVTTAVAFAVAVVLFIIILALYREAVPPSIEIYNTETGRVYCAFPAPEGTEFSVSFIHSVNINMQKGAAIFVYPDFNITVGSVNF